MTKYAHVSLRKRIDKTGIHTGGVEKFAFYLRWAIPEMELLSWTDYPGWIAQNDGLPDYEKAELLNQYLLEEGILDRGSTVVVDGFWGKGLQGEVDRLVSVVHGSYFGRFIEAQIHPWGEVVRADYMLEQLEFWEEPDVEVVCVSRQSQKELELACVRKPTALFYHGIDLGIYKPLDLERTEAMHAATSARKGLDILAVLAKRFDILLTSMNEKSGKMAREARRLNQARYLVAPTRHEGNAYLLIESIACGTPIITYATGLAREMPADCGIITDDISPNNFARQIGKMEKCVAMTGISDAARAWAEKHCSFERFANQWRNYLEC